MSRFFHYLSIVTALTGSACAAATDIATDPQVEANVDALFGPRESLDVELTLREASTVTVRLNSYESHARSAVSNVLAVPGFAATGATYEPLTHAILADRELHRKVKRITTVDFPGHGASGLPDAIRYGDLTINDEVSILVQAVRWLSEHDRGPDTLVGHSLGGLVVQATQEQLLSEGTSLNELGVRDVALLAPVPPHAQPWTLPPVTALQQFLVSDAELGDTLQLPPLVWVGFVFATPSGLPAWGAPLPAAAVARGFIATEPASTLFQLVEASVPLPDGGAIALERPSVQEGAFASEHGTRLHVVAFSDDTLVPAADVRSLASYLTGGDDTVLSELVSSTAVHGAYVSRPIAVKNLLREAFQ